MKIVVYHLNRTLCEHMGLGESSYMGATFGGKEDDVKRLWDARCYEPVAIVDETTTALDLHDALDAAFEKTNHIHSSWMENQQVVSIHRHGNRSSSVGDVMMALENGKRYCYIVAPCGFNPMPD